MVPRGSAINQLRLTHSNVVAVCPAYSRCFQQVGARRRVHVVDCAGFGSRGVCMCLNGPKRVKKHKSVFSQKQHHALELGLTGTVTVENCRSTAGTLS